jgi:hypothetical protein
MTLRSRSAPASVAAAGHTIWDDLTSTVPAWPGSTVRRPHQATYRDHGWSSSFRRMSSDSLETRSHCERQHRSRAVARVCAVIFRPRLLHRLHLLRLERRAFHRQVLPLAQQRRASLPVAVLDHRHPRNPRLHRTLQHNLLLHRHETIRNQNQPSQAVRCSAVQSGAPTGATATTNQPVSQSASQSVSQSICSIGN